MVVTIYDDKIKLDGDLSIPRNYNGTDQIPVTLIIHGFTGNKEEEHLVAVSDMLNDLGIATLRVDMYGHGRSDGRFFNHTLNKWIQNGMAAIDYLKEDGRFSDIYLCGHSQGGLMVMLLAAMERDKVKLLVPLSPATMIPKGCREGDMLGTRFDPVNVPDEVHSPDGWILGGNYVRVAQTIYVEEAIKKYTGPVLVVHGDADMTVDIEETKKDCSGYANCKFVTIKGDSHCYDYHLDEVVAAVKEYVSDFIKE